MRGDGGSPEITVVATGKEAREPKTYLQQVVVDDVAKMYFTTACCT